MPAAEVLDVEGVRILVTHGDAFQVKSDYGPLDGAARAHGCDAALFGHTHIKHLRLRPPVLFNPGPAVGGSYGIVEVSGGDMAFRHGRWEEITGGSAP